MKQVQLRGAIERQARKRYRCECKQEDCQEIIEPKEQYTLIKLVEKQLGEYNNRERKISHNCLWLQKWREFIQ